MQDQGGSSSDIVDNTLELKRNCLLRSLEEEAVEIVALEQRSAVIHSTCQVGDVDTSIRVDAVGITSESECGRVGHEFWNKVSQDIGNVVRNCYRASVPVLEGPSQ